MIIILIQQDEVNMGHSTTGYHLTPYLSNASPLNPLPHNKCKHPLSRILPPPHGQSLSIRRQYYHHISPLVISKLFKQSLTRLECFRHETWQHDRVRFETGGISRPLWNNPTTMQHCSRPAYQVHWGNCISLATSAPTFFFQPCKLHSSTTILWAWTLLDQLQAFGNCQLLTLSMLGTSSECSGIPANHLSIPTSSTWP